MSVTGSIMAATGLAGAGISAFGANSAANTQANAANNAANLQFQESQNALNFEEQQYQNSLRMMNPYLQTGYGALNLLRNGLGISGPMPQGFSPDSSTTQFPSGGSQTNVGDNTGNLSMLNNFLSSGNTGKVAQPFSATGSTVPMINPSARPGFNSPANPGQGALNPNDTSVTSGMPAQVPISGNPGGIAASTNQGGTAQIPTLASQGGADANGNQNIGFGSLLAPFTEQFQAPTNVTEQNDPGWQFRLNQGLNAITNSAAARGGLVSGGTEQALEQFAGQDASNEYSNVYDRAMQQYLNNYNIFTGNQTNQFNKLAAISGLGQTSASQLSNAGLAAGNNVSNTLLTTGSNVGNDLLNAGAARASGITGSTNAITGGLSSLGSLAMLSKLFGGTNPLAGTSETVDFTGTGFD